MRATSILRMYTSRVTLFSKPPRHRCGLCDEAGEMMRKLAKRPDSTFEYSEVDVMQPEHVKWFNQYAYDVPVLHVDRVMHTYSKENVVTLEGKLMHRFTEDQVLALVEKAEARVQDKEGQGVPGAAP